MKHTRVKVSVGKDLEKEKVSEKEREVLADTEERKEAEKERGNALTAGKQGILLGNVQNQRESGKEKEMREDM